MTERGKIIIHSSTNVWPHELFIARYLAFAGHIVEFIPANNRHRSADAFIDGAVFEFKSPMGSSIACVERNIKRAYKQSSNIVLSSFRMKKISDKNIITYLHNNRKLFRGVRRLIFVSRDGSVIDFSDWLHYH